MTRDYTALENAAREATQGEWSYLPRSSATVAVGRRNIANCAGYRDNIRWEESDAQNEANAQYIVAAQPSTILELLAELKRYRDVTPRTEAAEAFHEGFWNSEANDHFGDETVFNIKLKASAVTKIRRVLMQPQGGVDSPLSPDKITNAQIDKICWMALGDGACPEYRTEALKTIKNININGRKP